MNKGKRVLKIKINDEQYKKIESYFMESFIKDIKKTIGNLSKLLKSYNINFTIIGGLARNNYGFLKTTDDCDILISNKDKEKMKNLPIGYIKDISQGRAKVFKLHDPETKIEVIYSGEISGDGINGLKFPEPDKISNEIDGNPFITLEKLIEFKLSSGIYGKRLKDFSDIQELIKANRLGRDFADRFREDLKQKYIEIWEYKN